VLGRGSAECPAKAGIRQIDDDPWGGFTRCSQFLDTHLTSSLLPASDAGLTLSDLPTSLDTVGKCRANRCLPILHLSVSGYKSNLYLYEKGGVRGRADGRR
jgi:hypothetical protein